MRAQPRLPRGQKREALPSCVQKQIRAAVEHDARRYECSRSWVVATALAAFYGIDIMKPYEGKRKRNV